MHNNITADFKLSTIVLFVVSVAIMLFLEFFFHRENKNIKLNSAIIWSVAWVTIAILFSLYLYFSYGKNIAMLFISGYFLEKTLSIDNLFIFMAIFSWFNIPDNLRHRILFFGVIGAIFFRILFVFISSSLLKIAPWFEMVFGIAIIWTAIIMRFDDKPECKNISESRIYKFITSKVFPIWPELYKGQFFVSSKEIKEKTLTQVNKTRFFITPLFLCLLMIELSDILFAFDSVPAVVSISQEPLIIYSSMIFAVLGLRSMYFILEALRSHLDHLDKLVISLLILVGLKLFVSSIDAVFGIGVTVPPEAGFFAILGLIITFFSLKLFIFLRKRLKRVIR